MPTLNQSLLERFKQRLRNLYRRHALFVVTRDMSVPSIAPLVCVTYRQATLENIFDVLSFRAPDLVSTFEGHLKQGQLGILAYREGQAIAHGWLIINRTQSDTRANGYFRLRSREALVHYCSVAERNRGQRIYQSLLCELYRRAFATELVDRIYIDTEWDNAASRRAIQRTAGFLRKTHYLTLFSRGFELPRLRIPGGHGSTGR